MKTDLGMRQTLPKQDDWFNMGDALKHKDHLNGHGMAHSLTDNGTKNKHTCSPAGHSLWRKISADLEWNIR